MLTQNISFFVEGKPITQGSKNVFRGRVVESSKGLKEWRKAVAWEAKRASLLLKRRPLQGPLAITCNFWFRRPKRPSHEYPMPDVDKLIRAIFDGCKVGGLIVDDAQFTDSSETKRFASPAEMVGVKVTIKPALI